MLMVITWFALLFIAVVFLIQAVGKGVAGKTYVVQALLSVVFFLVFLWLYNPSVFPI